MSLLGQWPPVITGQTLEILDTLHRGNFMQYRVRFYWTPNEQTEGYLLVPDKEGKKPAVITTFYEPETAIGLSGKPYRDFAYQLTKRGKVRLCGMGRPRNCIRRNKRRLYQLLGTLVFGILSATMGKYME